MACGICGKGVQVNSVQCTVCKKWIHKRCSGDLSQLMDGFRHRRCDWTIQESDLTEDLMEDGETYKWVKMEWILLLQLESEMDGHLACILFEKIYDILI